MTALVGELDASGSPEENDLPALPERPGLHFERPCRAPLLRRRNPISATSSGLMKNKSGLSGIRSRVRARSTTPSTTISATWMPAGQSARAIDSARLRCAPFAAEKAADLAPALREAVAPTKTMLPCPPRFIAGITCFEARNPPKAFTRQAASKSAAVASSMLPQTPEPAL